MNYVELPPELISLEGKVQFVQRKSDNELHMSCPNCGVLPHHNDSRPSDRFVVWIESRMNGRPFGWCRTCGYKWSTDKADAVWTEEEKAAFAAKRRELNLREEERIKQYSLDVVMKQAAYTHYAEALKSSEYGKQYLAERGFNSDWWNDWFEFGMIDAYKVTGRLSTYYSPAITMPINGLMQIVENVKLRVTDPKHSDDRFRNIYKSGNQHPYFPMKEAKVGNKVAIFEGEMKSCMVAQWQMIPDDVTLIGSQGKGVGARLQYMVENCEVIYLCLDPDTFIPNEKGDTTIMQTAKKLGYDRTRIIYCKQKIDDAILGGFNLTNAYNMAVKPNQLGLKG